MADKKNWTPIVAAIIFAVILLIIFGVVKVMNTTNSASLEPTKKIQETYTIDEGMSKLLSSDSTTTKYTGNTLNLILRFVMGINLEKNDVSDSDFIILLSIWIMFLVILQDFVRLFGMMEKGTSMLVGALITIIIANVGLFNGIFSMLGIWFAALAGFGVIAALVSVIFFAFVSHWGISTFGARMMKRQAMLKAARMEAKGVELKGAIGAYLEGAKAFKED